MRKANFASFLFLNFLLLEVVEGWFSQIICSGERFEVSRVFLD